MNGGIRHGQFWVRVATILSAVILPVLPAAAGVVVLYTEALAIAYGRTVITLTTVSLPRPYFPESRRYLERVLLGRAEAFGR